MPAIPPCPACGVELSEERGLDDRYDFGEGRPARATIVVSCAGCLSVVSAESDAHEEAPVVVKLETGGAVVARFRDQIVEMRERDALEGEIRSLLEGPEALLCGVPEVAREILARGIQHVRTNENGYVTGAWYTTRWRRPPSKIEPYAEFVDHRNAKGAARDGEFGGFVSAQHGRTIVLAMQRFTVTGFYGGRARVGVPRAVARTLGADHPGFTIEWSMLVPDRVRRPL